MLRSLVGSEMCIRDSFMRAINWVANEFLVEALANNRAFQRMALRVHENSQAIKKEGHVTKVQEFIKTQTENISKQAEQMAKAASEAPPKPKQAEQAPKFESKPPPPPAPEPARPAAAAPPKDFERTTGTIHGGRGLSLIHI
eukprot:TRINITY_DN61827_c0_g1_i1.p3 TRINITY_DN61827_c0_g1~~TRINITY_DN61827_c0_g1_i1.p3  ORF type:complete len:142 (+),score=52.12 TRINITY_DN61827_c0_g1_i1:84-509(+)